MAVIGFSSKPNEIWCVAGWAFRQVLDDIMSQCPEDLEMANEFDEAKSYSSLSINLLEPKLAARVISAIQQVVAGILSGEIRSGIHGQPYGDPITVEQYREGLRQLLETLSAAEIKRKDYNSNFDALKQ